jgi:hypothetical protein
MVRAEATVIVTLCGSTRFEADFHEASLELGRRGIICFTLASFPTATGDVSTRGQALTESNYDKVMLDLGYFEKILRSDAILVLGDGYVGQSTAREILWAAQLGKGIVSQWDFVKMTVGVAGYEKLPWNDIVRRLKGADMTMAKNNAHSVVWLARRTLGGVE